MDISSSVSTSVMDSESMQTEETPSERRARTNEGFPQVERALAMQAGPAPRFSIFPSLPSSLGRANPMAREVDGERDVVWLLDNTAYRPVRSAPNRTQAWQAEFVVAYFKRHTGLGFSSWVAAIADAAGFGAGAADRTEVVARISERLQPMVATIRTGRYVNVKLPSHKMQRLGPAGTNGLSSQMVLKLGRHENGQTARIAPTLPLVAPHAPMITHFAEQTGWLVISDVDDSIKITNTVSPIGILVSTFVSDPTPVAGMPALYAHLHTLLTHPAWFYLSASPYTLYQFLRPFLHAHYPSGTLILRESSWQELSGYLRSLTMGTQAYKASRIEKIHRWFPHRKVICIGDSTQSDPEAYAEICRKWPGWIRGIFIRKVTDVSGMAAKNDPLRFAQAFEGIDESIWRVFETPEEVGKAMEDIKRRG